jgi:hypothetical protein
MGGFGSGGARVGAGRPRKSVAEAALTGGRIRSGLGAGRAPVPPAAVAMPAGLAPEVGAVWEALAPHALAAGTLTAGTVAAFVDLCRARVERVALEAIIQADGRTSVRVSYTPAGEEVREIKAHPLIAHARAMMLRIEAGMARFQLAPVGKALAQAEAPVDPFAAFDPSDSAALYAVRLTLPAVPPGAQLRARQWPAG